MITSKKVGLGLGPCLFFAILLFDLDPSNPAATKMAAVATLMAVWWITEAIPLAATALLPLILFPLLGILTGKATAPIYINSTIFLFVGGFMIALAMEKWHLQKRIAMMLPIGLAVVSQMELECKTDGIHNFTVCMMLGIAYSCSIGGIATLVGTPPNLSLARIFEITFPNAEPIGFGQWMLLGVPLSATMLFVAWILLTQFVFRIPATIKVDSTVIQEEYEKLGKMSFEEKVVFCAFLSTAAFYYSLKIIKTSRKNNHEC